MTISLDDVPAALRPDFALIKHLLGCHRRHLAGRPRAVADILYLREIVGRLRVLAKRVSAMPALHDVATQRVKLLQAELAQCKAAQLEAFALPAAERVTQLATRANQQFVLYRITFAGRSRMSRRPGVAERLYANLKYILEDMEGLDKAQLASPDAHVKNIELVAKEIEQLHDEGVQIATARHHATRDDLIRQLGADSGAEMLAYRTTVHGKDAASVDLDAFAGICDRLGDVVSQMAILAGQTDDSINLANLRLATRNLVAYEDEYLRLSESRTAATANVASGTA